MTTAAQQSHIWGKELSKLSGDECLELFNTHFQYMVNNYSIDEIMRTLKTLFKTYRIQLSPKLLAKIPNFFEKVSTVVLSKDFIDPEPYEDTV